MLLYLACAWICLGRPLDDLYGHSGGVCANRVDGALFTGDGMVLVAWACGEGNFELLWRWANGPTSSGIGVGLNLYIFILLSI